ncbi:MAG: hypothetical protein ACYTGG_04735 [Planctomycetota bacterium]|jgi:hypothetical protein
MRRKIGIVVLVAAASGGVAVQALGHPLMDVGGISECGSEISGGGVTCWFVDIDWWFMAPLLAVAALGAAMMVLPPWRTDTTG